MTATGLISRHEARRLVLDGTDDTGYPARKDRWYQFLGQVGDFEEYAAHSVRTWVAEHPPAGSVAPDAPDLRQTAIAAAVTAFTEAPVGPIISDTSNLESAIEDAVAAAFAKVAEGLYIADRPDWQPAVYDETRPPGRRCIIGPDVLSDRLWGLLAAVIPTRKEAP